MPLFLPLQSSIQFDALAVVLVFLIHRELVKYGIE